MKPVDQHHDWIEAIALLSDQAQPYVLITVLGARGSTPRDSGTKMVASNHGFYGSIGGGHLEFRALEIAAEMLASGLGDQRIERFSLGASLGQCCGGSHTLLFESFPGSDFNIAVFGAGHVGTALAGILQQLPCRLRWVDSREDQHSGHMRNNVKQVSCVDPAAEVNAMPAASYYLIMTHTHQQDFEILEQILIRGDARYIGLIGSETKWRRFKLRLEHKGYAPHTYENVHCPAGLSQVPGKMPMEIAVSIAGQIVAEYHAQDIGPVTRRGVEFRELKHLLSVDQS